MGEWREVFLDEVAREITVGHVGSMASEYRDQGIPFLRSLNIEPFGINTGSLKFISPAFHAKLRKSALSPGDVVIVRTGKPGTCAVIPAWLAGSNCSDLVIVRCGPNLLPRFLCYFVNSAAAHHISAHSVGAVQQHFNVDSARRLRIQLPPPHEQHRIAHILGALDDKIELNRRMSATLEEMARALFRSWFVDFDPVRAKAEGRDPGLPAEIAALFPDRFEDSESGEIPAGWEVADLARFCDLNPESWSRHTYPEVVRYVDLGNTKWGRLESVATLAAAVAPSRAQRVLRPKDTIVGTVRPSNGSFAFILEEGLTGSTGFAALRPKREEFAELAYLAATRLENIEELSRLADGGAYPAVRPDAVLATPVCAADLDVVSLFSGIVSAALARSSQLERESRTLASLRDTLLPKLISGELRVPEVAG